MPSQQMLQRLPIALAQVKAANTSENLLNDTEMKFHTKSITNIINTTNIINSIWNGCKNSKFWN